ncbi:hypothetical protein G6F56_009219 [Rhizopus delemar]|nr:hypothetical protein G6F56_009219 [Rhizopus delemar]
MIIPNNSEGTRSYGSSGYESLVIGSNNALSNTSNEEDSPPKRKYQRRPKPDTNAPTKPPSAYVAFSNATRPKLKHLKFEEISRKVGELWKHLSKHDRQSYERNAMIARDEYQARLEEYKQTKEYEAYKNYLNRFKKTKKRSSPDGSLGDISSNGMGSSNSSGSISSISSISSSGDNPTDPRMRGLIPVEFNHECFWSPTASIDPYPNFRYGFDVLHKKLTHSLDENKTIVQYISQRIESERTYANTLNKLYRPKDEEAMTGLARCFQVVCAESEASAKEHVARADNLHTTALDPLQRFSTRYSQRLSGTRHHIRTQLGRFESLVKQLEAAKSNYDSKCKSLMVSQPNYRLNVIKLGTRVFHDRFWIDDWIKTMPTDRSGITDWLQAEHQEPTVLHDLIGLNFVRQTAQDRFEKVLVSQPKTFSGFFKQQDMEKEMLVADKIYKDLVWQVDQMRTRIEQELLLHYEEMEKLELERIETLKQVFISLAASLSNTIPRYKETVDNMMLYQETLVPDKDVQTIVEQHRTGQFCPRPILYENYFYGTAHHQLFGVSLSEITRTEGTIVPNFITKALSMIETGK